MGRAQVVPIRENLRQKIVRGFLWAIFSLFTHFFYRSLSVIHNFKFRQSIFAGQSELAHKLYAAIFSFSDSSHK